MTSKTTKQTGRTAEKTAAEMTAAGKTAAEAAETIGAETRKTVDEGTQRMRQGLEAAVAFNQGNLEAVVASSSIAAKALETMTSEVAAYSKKSYEDGMAAAKELSSCRDVGELVAKQAEFQRRSIEGFVAEATRLNELCASATKDAFEPLGQRFTAAVDIVKDYRF